MPLSNYSFFCKKRALPILFCHKSEPSKQYMSFRIIWKKFATIATLGTNQDSTLIKNLSWMVFQALHSFFTPLSWIPSSPHIVQVGIPTDPIRNSVASTLRKHSAFLGPQTAGAVGLWGFRCLWRCPPRNC